MTSLEDNALTTDACPNYADSKNEDISEGKNEESAHLPHQEENEEINYDNVDTKKKARSKTKKINNQAYANVINISNSNSIHIGSNITINHGLAKSQKNNENIVKTKAIDMLLNSPEIVTVKDIMFVSSNIGEGWRYLFRMLNYFEAQIDQFHETHIQKGIKEVIYQILLDWLQNEPDDATMCRLTNALWNSDHKDVVYKLSQR